ncbi:MAG: hypothetical protein AAHH96_07135 [Candidatus Symbiodolus clandestinus]
MVNIVRFSLVSLQLLYPSSDWRQRVGLVLGSRSQPIDSQKWLATGSGEQMVRIFNRDLWQ